MVVGTREHNEDAWPTRRSQELVALLALAEGRRLLRDQVVEHLWPHLGADAGSANLRKAAHHARRTLGAPEAVVLRSGRVALFPDRELTVDVDEFLDAADLALQGGDAEECVRVAAGCPGTLLPESPYETWTQDPRRRVRDRLTALLRTTEDWARLMGVEPTDEAACRELMRSAIDAGERHVAIRWYERLRIALVRELGRQPDAQTEALHEQCTAGVRLGEEAFVGRDAELGDAVGLLRSVADGETRALVVRGPTGIGKSAFGREISRRAREDGWRTITVTDIASGTPYAAVGAVVEQVLAHGRESLATLPDRTRSILAELTPLAGPAPELEGAVTRHQVAAALRRALALSVTATPTLLFVEDAHLLDEATAGVLHQLVAGAGEEPLLVMLAFRAEWIRTSLAHGITELLESERTNTLQLGPLDDAQIGELIAVAAPVEPAPEAVERITAAAQGSPFFALELARALTTAEPDAPPQTVRQAVVAGFAGLDTETLDALTALAVAEDEFDLASVLALTGMEEREAFALLDAALDIGVLVVAGTHYRFRHGLVRQALTDELPPHRCLQLHRAAAERLAAAGAAPELIATHWLRGERPEEALDWLLAATRRAVAIGAFADARTQVERLLAEAPEHGEALCLHAEILDALGDSSAPDAYAAAAVALGDPEAQELRARQALAQLKASNPDGALRTLEGIEPKTTAGRLAEALTLSAAAAIGRYADADTAASKAAAAHELAVELGDPGAILDATWAQALAAHAKGELPARLREYLRSTSDMPELATHVFDGQLCVTERMLYGGLPNDEIIAFADELAAEAQRIGAARGHAFALTLRGEAGDPRGDARPSRPRLRRGSAPARGDRRGCRRGTVPARSGPGRDISRSPRARSPVPRRRPAHGTRVRGRASHARPHLRSHDRGGHRAAAGLEVIRQAETAIQGPAETCPTCRIAFTVPATIAAARAGDLERADRYGGDCEKAIEVVALPPAWHAAVEEARGWVVRARGDNRDAREHFRKAANAFEAWGQPLDAARCGALARA